MSDESPDGAFARQLQRLMRTRRQQDGSAWSVPSLAEAVGVSRQQMWYFTKGTKAPKWDTVVRLAELFDVATDAFTEGGLAEEERVRADAVGVLSRAGQEMPVGSLRSLVSFIQLLEQQEQQRTDDDETTQ